MARKPNYKFEKMERERQKAAKKAARRAAKEETKAGPEDRDTALDGPEGNKA
jgi:hypothetical protein